MQDPYWITARYNGQCICGKPIAAGERVMYRPGNKRLRHKSRVYCTNCSQSVELGLQAERSMDATGGRSDCIYDQ